MRPIVRGIAAALTGVALAVSGLAAGAQTAAAPQSAERSPVLTLDWERLYENSLWGKRVNDEIENASAALRTENNRIAGQLEAEERDLTERRSKMAPADFQAAANAFDKRATEIRAAQKAKADAIQRQLNDERQTFVRTVMPLLDEVLQTRGATVVLDSRVIIRGLAEADVTDELGKRVDKEIGDGAGRVPAEVPAPSSDPGTAAQPDTPSADTAPDQGGVYVDDSANKKAETGADPVLKGGAPPQPALPLGLPMPDESGSAN